MKTPSKRPNFHPQPSFPYEFYQNLYKARPNFHKKDEFIVPLEVRGRGFVVKRGESARIVCVEGPQIVDTVHLERQQLQGTVLGGLHLK